jgi:hypothetical protein
MQEASLLLGDIGFFFVYDYMQQPWRSVLSGKILRERPKNKSLTWQSSLAWQCMANIGFPCWNRGIYAI